MNPTQPTNHRADKILATIKAEGIYPTSRYVFLCQNVFVWLFWLLSILIGALAIAILFHGFMTGWYDFFEATHNSWFSFTYAVIPKIWLFVFVLMAYIAYVNMRHTKTGYRYPFWQILLSSIGFGVLGGALLQAMGMGMMVDRMLGEHMPVYPSQVHLEEKMWQMPEEGRLLGVALTDNVPMRFVDIDRNEWILITDDLMEQEIKELWMMKGVRLVGMVTSSSTFHVCAVMPSAKHEYMPPEQIARYGERARGKLANWYTPDDIASELSVGSNTKDNPCMQHPLLLKLSQ